jgi:hypothetical protein
MEQMEGKHCLVASQLALWKAALNWFFRAAKSASANLATPCVRDREPPLAMTDLGGPEWEQKLIREIRSRHYEWRTEQVYRMWAGRFARWLAAKGSGMGVMTASENEIRIFLSDLATRQRVSASTQRQALCSIVFLIREALGRPLADFGQFERARTMKRLIESGTDIRTVQELLGHKELTTTQIYTHVMQKPGLGVKSPLDG